MTWTIRASLAVWGVALAIGLMPRLQGKAGAEDLPGAMTAAKLDPGGPLLQFAALLLLPLLVVLAGQRLAPLVSERRWLAWAFSATLFSAPVTLMHFGTLRHVVLHGVVAGALLFARRLEPRFTRADALLVPCVLTLYFAFLDVGFGRTPAATFFRAAATLLVLRLAVGWISARIGRGHRPGVAFAFVPLAFLLQMHWLEPKLAGILSLVWIIGTPLLLAHFDERRVIRAAAWSALPLAAAAFPLSLIGAASTPVLDFFEDGHSLLPASEMARGELPYRDILPMHGLLSDGGLDLAATQLIRDDLGTILTSRRYVAALSATAIYFTALSITTSAELSLLAVFFSLAFFPATALWTRGILALGALACAAAATRLRAPRWLIGAGAFAVASTLVSLDLALCSIAVVLLAAIRLRALKPLLLGIAIVAVPLLLLFGILGFLPHFFRSTLFEVLSTGGIYTMGPLTPPQGTRTLAELAGALTNPETFAAIVWLVALVGSTLVIASRPFRAKRSDAVWLAGGWIVLAGAAYVLRRHFYLAFALAPFVFGALLALRRRSRPAALALVILLAFFAKPFALVFDLSSPLRRSGGVQTDAWREYKGVPRARGAVALPATVEGLETTRRFLTTALKPDETFFDFANAGALYYLFDRPCPIRYTEVPAYQREDQQRAVIAALERDRSVRAALITIPTGYTTIDGVSNQDRAPLVWAYVQQNFQPAFDEGGVVFWMRK